MLSVDANENNQKNKKVSLAKKKKTTLPVQHTF